MNWRFLPYLQRSWCLLAWFSFPGRCAEPVSKVPCHSINFRILPVFSSGISAPVSMLERLANVGDSVVHFPPLMVRPAMGACENKTHEGPWDSLCLRRTDL